MKKSLAILVLLALHTLAAPPAGLDPERLARIPARMKEFVAQGTVAGAVID